MLNASEPTLDESLAIDPDADVESWRLTLPGRAACYLLEDADGGPVLLATVGGLRGAVVRRMTEPDEPDEPSKRIDYRQIVRRVRWRGVESRFEANWAYLENARRLFPKTYKRMVRRWRAHWVGIDLGDPHPRFVAKDQPHGPASTCFGPLPTGRSARKLVELLEDLFDLCRKHDILVKAPHGEACSYKEMGRCPAPCDGTVTMDAYRTQLDAALDFLKQPIETWVASAQRAMQEASERLDFERAGLIKRQIDKAKSAVTIAGEGVVALDTFRYISLQRGSRKGHVRAFGIVPGHVTFLGKIAPKQREVAIVKLIEHAECLADAPIDSSSAAGIERIGLVGWHLSGGRQQDGVFLPLDRVSDASLTEAIALLDDRKTANVEESDSNTADKADASDKAASSSGGGDA